MGLSPPGGALSLRQVGSEYGGLAPDSLSEHAAARPWTSSVLSSHWYTTVTFSGTYTNFVLINNLSGISTAHGLVVNLSGIFYATNTSNFGLITGNLSSWPGVFINITGTIYGRSGAGGNGASASGTPGTPGLSGQAAVFISSGNTSSKLWIGTPNNFKYNIKGGGGGGGGGGYSSALNYTASGKNNSCIGPSGTRYAAGGGGGGGGKTIYDYGNYGLAGTGTQTQAPVNGKPGYQGGGGGAGGINSYSPYSGAGCTISYVFGGYGGGGGYLNGDTFRYPTAGGGVSPGAAGSNSGNVVNANFATWVASI